MSDDGGYEYDYGDDGGYDYGGDEYDYGGGGGDDAEAEENWETKIDNQYAIAKQGMDSDPGGSEAAFLQMLTDDQDKAKWSFKALKMLCRLYQRQRWVEKLVPMYARLVEWNHTGITRAEKEKAVNKFIDRCTNITTDTMLRIYDVTLKVLGAKHEALWFSCKLRQAKALVSNKELDTAERSLKRLVEWGTSGNPDTVLRRGPQLMQVYAQLLQIYVELERFDKVQEIFAKANSNDAHVAVAIRAVIHECGAQMYMAQGAWERAYRQYTEAFHKYDESGDGRRIRALKSLVVAATLAKTVSDHVVNPFAAPEAAAYKQDDEIVAISALIDAADQKDAPRFDAILADPKNRRAIYGDKQIYKYLESFIHAFRVTKLRSLCAPFTQVKLSFLAKEMNISEDEAERMCVTAILEGSIDALIDQPARVLMLPEPLSADVDRSAALLEWSRQISKRFDAIGARAARSTVVREGNSSSNNYRYDAMF